MSGRLLQVLAAAAMLLVAFAPAGAHPGIFASALVKVEADGIVTVTIRHDALAFALDALPAVVEDEPMLALLDGPDRALDATLDETRQRFVEQFYLEVDGRAVPFELLTSPTAADVREWERSQAVRALPVRLDYIARTRVPSGVHTVSMMFPPAMGDVITTFDRPNLEPFALPIGTAELSPPLDVHVQSPPPAAASDASPTTDTPPTSSPTTARQDSAPAAAASPSLATVARQYIALGFAHIIPKGLDHVLFVLGLFLLSPKLKPLLWQVTAFTLAHTLTLALTVMGKLPDVPNIVEPLIAASIAFVAVENLVTSKLHAWRPLLVFAFGLLHGMGFAGVLKDAGLPEGQLATALITFNIGVELGQLAVIAGALALVGWFRGKPWYRPAITIPASVIIAAVAIWWTLERVGVVGS
ncbi:MAG TPA: HupE/UreJ family protein [Phycisphaerales bacterium]|nr:HupE/UreJ family protein [Phycisphaerales bacterium]